MNSSKLLTCFIFYVEENKNNTITNFDKIKLLQGRSIQQAEIINKRIIQEKVSNSKPDEDFSQSRFRSHFKTNVINKALISL